MDLFSLPFAQDAAGTSKEAAQRFPLPTAGSQAARVLALIRASEGLTDRQLAELTGYAINVICARRNALVKDGWVKAGGTVIGARNVRNIRWVSNAAAAPQRSE